MVALQNKSALSTSVNMKDNSHISAQHGTLAMEKGSQTKSGTISDPDFLSRPAWYNARTALNVIRKGKATGNKPALWLRAKMQEELFSLGHFIQIHAGKVLFVGFLVLVVFCVGLKSARIESKIENLWVEEGGRLQKELQYVEAHLGLGAGATSEMIIQTPIEDSGTASILTSEAMLSHLDVLQAATKVVVDHEDVSWKLRDLCYAQSIPLSEVQMIDQIMENLFPCSIITPLDCFWEGSKLLDSDHPVHIPLGNEGSMPLSWKTLNPTNLLQDMKRFSNVFDFKSFEEYMKRAGITTGYQNKPCLNPFDPDCPETSPNKNSIQIPNIGAELTGGCYGFASRYNHWPEQLVVGGTSKNKTGHITRAKGLQSVVQLMGEKDLFDFYSDTYKVHSLDWSREKAAEILADWQGKFSREVTRLTMEKSLSKKYDINAYSNYQLDEIMEEFSEFSLVNLAIGLGLMALYASLTMMKWSDEVFSQSGIGFCGVILVALSVASGLGLCGILDITFNATTSQIVPFLALGLGVDAMFLLAHTYGETVSKRRNPAKENIIGDVLRKSGISVLLMAVCNIAAFLAAAVIPIPALRAFSLQAAILVAFNSVAMTILFPAVLALDLRRIQADRVDVLCCYSGRKFREKRCLKEQKKAAKSAANNSSSLFDEQYPGDEKCYVNSNEVASEPFQVTLTGFASLQFGPWLTKAPFKVLITAICLALTVLGVYGMTVMEDGLTLSDVVPQNTSVYHFLNAQDKYFGFYNMYAVSQGNFEYPQNQKLLYDYHNAFVRIPNIIKDDNGGLPEFWLSLFRNWLANLQTAFDDDFVDGKIDTKGWHKNASESGILAFKLMVQTGHVDYPVDQTLVTRNRLVDSHGIINPSAFYNYLSAWFTNDAMAYSFAQGNIVPTPKLWLHDSRDFDLKIPKSQPIAYAQIPFYMYDLGQTDVMVDTIRMVREVCQSFEERGLPNFPRGIPFTFWEQYLHLRLWTVIALGAILGAMFLVTAFFLMNTWLAAILTVVVGLMVVQLLGFMGVIGIKLSAIPAVILIIAAGMGLQFTLHLGIGFITSIGNKNRRILMAVEHVFAPVLHGAVSTFLGITMLAFSHFDFIFRYFFLVLTAMIVLGVFNGLIFLPVFLAFLGPPGDVIPNESSEAIAPPTPDVSHNNKKNGQRPRIHIKNNPQRPMPQPLSKRHNSDLSLSTIDEESQSYHTSSQSDQGGNPINIGGGTSVFLEPEVVVETTTIPNPQSSTSSRCSTPNQVTKVTATAKFKVEVHAPTNASTNERPQSSASSRRSRRSPKMNNDQNTPSSVHSSLTDSLRSSLSNSVASSLSSEAGDPGFSEK
ncbi:protein patched homolog 1-like isoform X1 [Tigriopus californicus]|uniref:protein patched homolog 1-like isoform X1 n=2 Tax=Tigriopus californicus TaxID=6832 RepID=UPI0027D9DE74|nr:protein patched homolog 1-like isoform X1 [Tigriopus californicus]